MRSLNFGEGNFCCKVFLLYIFIHSRLFVTCERLQLGSEKLSCFLKFLNQGTLSKILICLILVTYRFLIFFVVSLKKDFPFANVPVPNVTYLDDGKKMITLKCDFVVPNWDNVSFEIQWFVNGRGLGPVVCDNPRTSNCAQLRATDYSLGSHVSKFLCTVFICLFCIIISMYNNLHLIF